MKTAEKITGGSEKNPDVIRIILDDSKEEEFEKPIKTYSVDRTPRRDKSFSKYGTDDPELSILEKLDVPEKRHGLLKKLLLFALIVLIVFGLTGAVVIYRMFGVELNKDHSRIARENEDFVTDEYDIEYADENVFEELEPEDVKLELVEPLGDEELINILLVGQDRRPGETRARSDVMIVCSINLNTGEVGIVSFLRDLYVTIPGYSDNRLNAAYAFGGFDLIKETLRANFGVTVDGCFEADFDEFISVIDIIGGTDIELTEKEAGVIGGGAHAGICHLNGEQTLKFARIRKLDSDFGRSERQRKVILACLEKARHLDINELLTLVKTAMPYLSTDLTPTQITKLITKITPLISKIAIGTYFIPAEDCYTDAIIKGMAVLVPDLKSNRDLLKNEYFPF